MSKTEIKFKIKKELLRPKVRHPIKPSRRIAAKTDYSRKKKHKKGESDE